MSASASDVACVLCGGRERSTVFTEQDVDIVRCSSCGHVYSTFTTDVNYEGYWGEQIEAIDDDARFYWDHAHAAMYRTFRERFVYGSSGRLLDVGCGLGFFVRSMEGIDGWESVGWEISPVAAKYGTEELGVRILSGPLERAGFAPQSFDLITMWDVIEHLSDPHGLLGHCRELLRPDGRLFLHTPNIDVQLVKARVLSQGGFRLGSGYLQPFDHVNQYSPRSLRRLLERNGFDRLEFHHLPPVQSVGGGRSTLATLVKNGAFQTARIVAAATGGRINLDNLFVLARPAA